MSHLKKKLLEIIGANASVSDIKTILEKDPYNLKVRYNDTYCLLKYDRSKSDLNNEFIRECRGLIFRLDNYNIVNHGISYGLPEHEFISTYNIDDCLVEESIDGTLLNIFYDNNTWNIATKGCIDASESRWYSNKSFLDIKEIRHPIIELINDKHEYITNNISFGIDHDGVLLFGTNSCVCKYISTIYIVFNNIIRNCYCVYN